MIVAREFTSAAEMRAHYAAVHQRCVNPVVLTREPVVIEAAARFVTRRIPLWMVKDISFDAHLVEWRARAGNQSKAYLKDRCAELGVSYLEIIGGSRRRAIIPFRHQIMWEISDKFGLNNAAIGRMFGGRDHTTVLHAVRKIEAQRGEA